MYIPNPLPRGPYYTYVFKVRDKAQFKIGFSTNPHARLKGMQSRRLRLTEFRRWEFQNYFAALYLEQQIIAYLKRFEFMPMGIYDDWYEIDEEVMKVVVEIATDLAKRIHGWEHANWDLDCVPLKGTPYYDRWIMDDQISRARRRHKLLEPISAG